MDNEELPEHLVYTPPVIEFVTVAAESCLLLERVAETDRAQFVLKGIKMLSLLYFKTSVLDVPGRVFEDMTERFVTEADYDMVKNQLAVLMGDKDIYLETFHPDMSLSDTPIAVFVSENLADVYQELKDFAANYQLGVTDVMNDALVACLEAFGEHWGQKLLSVLRALHHIRYNDESTLDVINLPDETETKMDRDTMLDFLRNDDDEINPLI